MKTAAVLLADVRSWRQGICPLPLSPFLEICHPRKGGGGGRRLNIRMIGLNANEWQAFKNFSNKREGKPVYSIL